jgi:hypothetical protein
MATQRFDLATFAERGSPYRRSISAAPEEVFGFLRTLDNHIALMPDAPQSGTVGRDGARIRLHGPLVIRRTVRAQLGYTHSPDSIVGRVETGRSTRGTVRWSIQRSDRGSWVEVVAAAEHLGGLDRLLPFVGGRRWLGRSLRLALERLEERLSRSGAGESGGTGPA